MTEPTWKRARVMLMILDHGGRVITSYAHLSATQVQPSQRVRQADQIAFMRLRLDCPVSIGPCPVA